MYEKKESEVSRMRLSEGFRIRLGVALFAILSIFGMFIPSTANAMGNGDELINEIKSSSDPWSTLDVMSSSDKLEVLAVLEDFDMGQLDAIFQEHTPVSARASAGYSDILWSTLEKAACVVHVDLISCNIANKDAKTASTAAGNYYVPSVLHNGSGDAFRHCYWSALMTIHIGESGAMKIGSNHEVVRNGPAKEKQMDLANNKTGRAIGKAQKTDAKSKNECRVRANQRKLVTLK